MLSPDPTSPERPEERQRVVRTGRQGHSGRDLCGRQKPLANGVMYNGVLSDVLTQALGWDGSPPGGFTPRSRCTKLSASPEELQQAFSTRSSAIENERDDPDLVALDGRIRMHR